MRRCGNASQNFRFTSRAADDGVRCRPEAAFTLNCRLLWQSCGDEDSPARWVACDVSEDRQLCIVCFRGTAGGRSRWSWLACEHCHDIRTPPSNRHGVQSLWR